MEDMRAKCLMCDQQFPPEEMRAVPCAFAPGARFVFGCKQYVRKGMYLPTLKFLIGPILAGLEVRGGTPVCPACRRVTILWSVAVYLLVVAGVVAVFIGQ
jgi:hypothetical protein